jgi:hypothetical protein
MFKFAFYNWTDNRENYDCTIAPRAFDRFTIEWYTADHCCDMQLPMRANLAPRIVGARELWWFNGEPSPGAAYPTEIRLTAQPSGYSYTWTVTAGTDDVELVDPTANPVRVRSANFSPIAGGHNNVQIRVTGQFGGPSNPQRLTVLEPYDLVLNSIRDLGYPGFPDGYDSVLRYRTRDQFGVDLPAAPIPINEEFGPQHHLGGSNWQRGLPGNSARNPQNWPDFISIHSAPGFHPIPQAPAAGSDLLTCNSPGQTQVDWWPGDWHIGSLTSGLGVEVQTNNWVRYLNHARHCDIHSPIP